MKDNQKTWGLLTLAVASALLPAVVRAEDAPAPTGSAAETALLRFAKEWKPQRGYMRPLDDKGWKVRMEVLQKLARLGNKASPALTAALAKGDPETRILAAQALGILADPDTRTALEAAVKDPEAAVRLYAIDALSVLGRVPATDSYRQIRDQDANRDVRSHMDFALKRDIKWRPGETRKALLDYDLSTLDTARLGAAAPEIVLNDVQGKTHRLSQFRGKKAVVLVFLYGDT